jgi:hypothetical protein
VFLRHVISIQWLLLFLPMLIFAYQDIPEIPDPQIVPMTFLEQERAVVLRELRYYKLKGNENVLHLGCRDGYLSNEIASYLPEGHLIGLENVYANEPPISLSNVNLLQGKFLEQGWENLYDYIICTQFDEWDEIPDELFHGLKKP